MKTNWDKFANESATFLGWAMIVTCTSNFTTYDQLREVENFFMGKDTTVSHFRRRGLR